MRRAWVVLAVVLGLAVSASAALAVPPVGGLTARGCIARLATVCPTTAAGLNGANGVAVSPDGADVYVAATAADAIDTFQRNPDGSLTYVGCIKNTGSSTSCTATADHLDGPEDLVVSADGAHVFVTASASDSVILKLDRSPSGVLSKGDESCVDDMNMGCQATSIDEPRGLVVSPNGDTLYVAEFGGAPDGVTSLSIASNGDLSDADTVGAGATDGIDEVAAEPNGDNIYVAGTTTNDVQRWPLKADGTIDSSIATTFCIIKAPAGGGCTKGAVGLAGAHGLGMAPDGKDLYVAAPTADAIVDISLTANGGMSDGGCIENTGSSTGCATSAHGLNGVSEVVVSPDGHNVYATSMTPANTVVAFTRNADGSLTPINCVNAASSATCSTSALGLGGTAGLAVDPSGLDVFVTGTTADAVTWLASNRAPSCTPGSAVSVGGAPITLSLACADPNGDPLSRSIDVAPAHGTIGPIDQAAGTVTYTPAAGFLGTDALTFSAGDGGAASADALETITDTAAPVVPPPTPTPTPTPNPAPPPPAHAPELHKLAISPTRLRIGTHVAKPASTVHTGATISFTLDIAATVKLTFDREESGRLVGHRCEAATRARVHHARCTRKVDKGSQSVHAKAGATRLRFEGLLPTHRPLAIGRYSMRAVATAAGHSGGAHTVSFTLYARHH